ncbi:hypothetical protein HYG89_14280 [Acinetobacter sp. SwsAc5]|uniref:hypothetical protein n=1 Tax=Acinetobacter sp. SwsAc5 TaxID=2749438 RepID=UPI0015BC3BBD|nr:hypothetical protein [Acinetobacter sp. SwsAc5]NWK53691.1 hypothetical protein [Acinetobacter sp. SwsAc5]
METGIQRCPNIEKNVALIYITDPTFLERSRCPVLVGDYSKDGYQILKTPVRFINPHFDFNLSFEILHHVRVISVPTESCEATLLKFDNGEIFDIELSEHGSLIEGMTKEETEKFIKENMKLVPKDHYKAMQTALSLHFTSRCR